MPISPPSWLTEAKQLKRIVDMGGDPMSDRHDDRASPDVSHLARRYLEEHAVRKAPRSRMDDQSMLEKLVLPEIGRMKVARVRRDDIDRIHREVSKTRPIRANRVAQLLSKMFALAIRWEYRTDNPVQGLEKNQEGRRNRYLSMDELERLTAVLNHHPNRRCANIIKLLLFTGARRGEVMNATWDQFDLEEGVWVKPSAHTKQRKEHRVPLSEEAVELLSDIKSEAASSPYVFPGKSPERPLSEIKTFWMGVCRKAGLEDFRIHDLRHTYASILASEGLGLPIIGALLGHTQPQTTARYSHLYDDPLRVTQLL
jgi:integrase